MLALKSVLLADTKIASPDQCIQCPLPTFEQHSDQWQHRTVHCTARAAPSMLHKLPQKWRCMAPNPAFYLTLHFKVILKRHEPCKKIKNGPLHITILRYNPVQLFAASATKEAKTFGKNVCIVVLAYQNGGGGGGAVWHGASPGRHTPANPRRHIPTGHNSERGCM